MATQKVKWTYRERLAWLPDEDKAALIIQLREKAKDIAIQLRELQNLLELKGSRKERKPKARSVREPKAAK